MGVNLDASDLREALWDFMQKWEANHQWVFTDLTDAMTKHTEALNANTAAMAGKVQPEPYTGDLQGQIADLQRRIAAQEARAAVQPATIPQGTLDHILGKINEQSRRIAALEQGQCCANTQQPHVPDANLIAEEYKHRRAEQASGLT